MVERQYIKAQEVEPLDGRNDIYVICLYDRLAKEASQLVYLKNLDLIQRFFKNSVGNLDPFEIEVYILGIFNTEELHLRSIGVFVEMNDFKKELKKELANASS